MSHLIPGEYDVTLNGVSIHYTVRGSGPTMITHSGGPGFLCPLLIAALFGAVATVINITPTPAMVFAGIHKQPATAILIGTLTYPLTVFGRH